MLTKSRTKEDEKFGGKPCEGESSMEEKCPFEHCPGNTITLIFVLNISITGNVFKNRL